MKTTNLMAIIASGMRGEQVLNWDLDLTGNAVSFDTEQPDHYFYKAQSSAHYLGLQVDNRSYYDAFKMRKWSGPRQRMKGIERYCAKKKDVELIIVDGVLDLVKSMNDENEVVEVGERLLTLSATYNPLMLLVIHTSGKWKGKLKNAIGHLGAYWQRKCDFAIELVPDENSGFVTVRYKFGRTAPFPSWEFTRNRQGYPVLSHNEKVRLPEPLMMDGRKKEKTPF